MLDNNKNFDNKAFYTFVGVIVVFALIVTLISLSSLNKNTHYEQPKSERKLGDIVGKKTTSTDEQLDIQLEHTP